MQATPLPLLQFGGTQLKIKLHEPPPFYNKAYEEDGVGRVLIDEDTLDLATDFEPAEKDKNKSFLKRALAHFMTPGFPGEQLKHLEQENAEHLRILQQEYVGDEERAWRERAILANETLMARMKNRETKPSGLFNNIWNLIVAPAFDFEMEAQELFNGLQKGDADD